ncbi:MAG: hypothetical protein ACFWTJ_04700 [Lachnoclostridium sp.]|jgi:hypothetical protein
MKQLLKMELKRAFINRGMLYSVLIGMVLSIWHIIQVVLPMSERIKKLDVGIYPGSLFYIWLGGNTYPIQSYLFYLILPILATLPYGTSLFEDKNGGMLKNIYTRTEKKSFLISKYLATFISGGCAVVFPLVVNLALTSTMIPALIPEPSENATLMPISIMYEIYYTHPWIYTIIFIFIDFIFAGLIAALSLLVTFYVEYKFIALVASFICYLFLYSVFHLFERMEYSPSLFLNPGFYENNWLEYIISFLILFILSFFILLILLERN